MNVFCETEYSLHVIQKKKGPTLLKFEMRTALLVGTTETVHPGMNVFCETGILQKKEGTNTVKV
jgi:hypothetical protein